MNNFQFVNYMFSIGLNSLDPEQAQARFVGPDLGPNCLQRLSADVTISGIELNF